MPRAVSAGLVGHLRAVCFCGVMDEFTMSHKDLLNNRPNALQTALDDLVTFGVLDLAQDTENLPVNDQQPVLHGGKGLDYLLNQASAMCLWGT